MKLQADCIGTLAAEALKREHFLGTVTNSFENSFYVRTSRNELLFFTKGTVKSPITINVQSGSNSSLKIPTRMSLVTYGGEMVGENIRISIEGARNYSRAIARTLSRRHSADMLELGSRILRVVDTQLSVLDPHGLANDRTAEFVRSGILPLRYESDSSRFLIQATNLIGLGCGFTPSGDDFLGGFLATYNTLSDAIERVQIFLDFRSLETRTSWISAKLLDYMQSLILDEQIASLIDAAVNMDETEFVFALETLLARGHTSGIDVLAGAILAVSLVMDIVDKTELTEKIATGLGLL